MTLIPLRNRSGVVVAHAQVDDEDFERVATRGRWCLTGDGYVTHGNRGAMSKLHRFVIDAPPGMHVDHIDRDPLNCQKSNLRLATAAENGQNRSATGNKNSTSGFRGVHWSKGAGKWRADVMLNRRSYFLGHYETPEEANAVLVAWREAHMPYSQEALSHA